MVATAIIPGDIWRYYTGNSRILFKRPERLTLLELPHERQFLDVGEEFMILETIGTDPAKERWVHAIVLGTEKMGWFYLDDSGRG